MKQKRRKLIIIISILFMTLGTVLSFLAAVMNMAN